MNRTVQFENVSKKYMLGLTRTSLPSMASRWASGLFQRSIPKTSPDNILWALRDVSFELSPGECLGLIGQNGAGKSTMLKLLANITHPTSGKIFVNGRLSALIELGSGFHPDLTGRENVFLNGTVLGLKRSELGRRLMRSWRFPRLKSSSTRRSSVIHLACWCVLGLQSHPASSRMFF